MKKSTALMAFLLSAGLIFSSCGNSSEEDSSSSFSDIPESSQLESSATDSTWRTQTIEPTTPGISPPVTIPAVTSPPKNSLPDICDSRYGYYQLNADEKSVYDQLVLGIRNFQPTITLKRELDTETTKRIVDMIRTENADLYYLGVVEFTSNKITHIMSYVTISYLYTQTEVEQLNAATAEGIQKILAKVPTGSSDITKIKIFHDQIILNCTYNATYHYANTPYGALVTGQAACEGYARAFAMLCNKAGIENLFAPGTYGEEKHIWNMVRLDGNWYNIDLTWDDPPYDSDNQATPPYYIQYNYYLYRTGDGDPNLTLDENPYTLPKTDSDFYSYFSYYGYYAKSYDEAIQILADQLEYALKTNRKFLRIRFSSPEAYAEMTQKIADKKCELGSPYISPFNKVKHYWVYQDPTLNILQFEIAELDTSE